MNLRSFIWGSILLAGGCSPSYHGFLLEDASPVPEFPVKKDVVLLYFGYTHCPDVCPVVLSKFRETYQGLPEHVRARTGVVMISIDPMDTPKSVRNYARSFHPDFVGLAPDSAFLERMKVSLGVMHFSGEGGLQEHLAMVFLLHKNRPLLIYPVEFSPEGLARDIQTVLFPLRSKIDAMFKAFPGV